MCAFFLAVFLVKYRIEYALMFPCVVTLFGVYYAVALTPGSVARRPERLFRSKPVLAAAALTALVFAAATAVDLPSFAALAEQTYIELP